MGRPPALSIAADHAGRGKARTIELRLANTSTVPVDVTIIDESYGAPERRVHLRAGKRQAVRLNVTASHGWYDVRVRAAGLAYRYAGRVETGEWSITDPAMGGA